MLNPVEKACLVFFACYVVTVATVARFDRYAIAVAEGLAASLADARADRAEWAAELPTCDTFDCWE